MVVVVVVVVVVVAMVVKEEEKVMRFKVQELLRRMVPEMDSAVNGAQQIPLLHLVKSTVAETASDSGLMVVVVVVAGEEVMEQEQKEEMVVETAERIEGRFQTRLQRVRRVPA